MLLWNWRITLAPLFRIAPTIGIASLFARSSFLDQTSSAISTYYRLTPKSDPIGSNMTSIWLQYDFNMTSKPGRFHDLRLPPSCSSILNRHVLEIYDLLMNSVIAPLELVPCPFQGGGRHVICSTSLSQLVRCFKYLEIILRMKL